MKKNDSLCLTAAFRKWVQLELKNKPDKPYTISTNGKSYTLLEILDEIENETEFGNQLKISVLKMTIELLIRSKETLD